MKIYTILLLIACLLTASTCARAQTITYHNKSTSLKEILKAVQKQAGYGHIFKGEAAQRVKRVNISVNNLPVKEVLDLFFKDQPLTYTIIGQVISIQPKESSPEDIYTISGRVTNESNEPVPQATINLVGTTRSVVANEDGEFLFPDVSKRAKLLFSNVAYESFEKQLNGESVLIVKLKTRVSELSEVAVIVSTGYQNVVQEKSVGSYAKVNNELFNRRVSANALDRLDGITPGMIFNKNIVPGTNQSKITVRGRSTIFSNAEPLVVVDNFPYPGDPANINPNDIESITVLKDANAAAIWGAFAGNGVIIITTKKGRYKQEPNLTINNNVTVGQKPDAYYIPTLGSHDYIEMERQLFEDGFYAAIENDPVPKVLSPVVEALIEARDGRITQSELEAKLAQFQYQDTRREKDKYLFRNSVSQQHAVSTSGGGVNNHYFLSAGFDRGLEGFVGNKWQRITLNANNTYSWFKNRLELNTGFAYSETKGTNNYQDDLVTYPYLKFFNNSGVPNSTPIDIRQYYKDTVVPQYPGLRNWNYNLWDEIHKSDNRINVTDYRVNLGLKYKVAQGITASLLYQFNRGRKEGESYKSEETYFTRNMINQFAQLSGGEIEYRVPEGGISDQVQETYTAHNVRAQLNYSNTWYDKKDRSHSISAIGGAEVRDIKVHSTEKRLFGYTKGKPGSVAVNGDEFYPLFYAPWLTQTIFNPATDRTRIDRYVSYYMTSSYSLLRRYTLSVSARKDESNLFGVRTNQKGVPLFSIGAGWVISEEKFYHYNWLPDLKIRLTHGYNGNVNKSVSAYTTAQPGATNPYGLPTSVIFNPLNPDLRWEKIQMTNFGLDFRIANQIVEGSIDYYIKRGTDLIGMGPIDPTTGVTQFTGNVAEMKGSGFDISIYTKNIDRKLKWNSVVLFNTSVDKVTNYKAMLPAIGDYLISTQFSPLEDRPLYSIFSLRWAGLDPQNGDPMGYIGGDTVSKDYLRMTGSANFDNLVFHGPTNPVIFGSIRNTFSLKQFSLSFNITWKAGHYFRRNSIEYFRTIYGMDKGHPDFNLRWQKPGDELITNIPSFDPMGSEHRDLFYKFSEVLVEKGDHIRLQDIQISYDISKQQFKKLPMQLIHFYIYANNIGILWKATEVNIDPDYVRDLPNPRSFSAGVKIEF